jgi:hypothetical protein
MHIERLEHSPIREPNKKLNLKTCIFILFFLQLQHGR